MELTCRGAPCGRPFPRLARRDRAVISAQYKPSSLQPLRLSYRRATSPYTGEALARRSISTRSATGRPQGSPLHVHPNSTPRAKKNHPAETGWFFRAYLIPRPARSDPRSGSRSCRPWPTPARSGGRCRPAPPPAPARARAARGWTGRCAYGRSRCR